MNKQTAKKGSVITRVCAWITAACLPLLLCACATGGEEAASVLPTATPTQTPIALPTFTYHPPVHIAFESIGLDAQIGPVGIDETGAMDVIDSLEVVSWYEPGFMPGEKGNMILAAHRVWKGEQGPFYNLEAAKQHDLVIITDEDGREWEYVVSTIDRISYTDPPGYVMSQKGEERVTMITCVGDYSTDLGTSEERHVLVLVRKEKR